MTVAASVLREMGRAEVQRAVDAGVEAGAVGSASGTCRNGELQWVRVGEKTGELSGVLTEK